MKNIKSSYASVATDPFVGVVVVVVVIVVAAFAYFAVLAVAGGSDICLGRSLTALLAHVGCDSRLNVDGLHVRRTNDIAFRRISDLFLRNDTIDFYKKK